MRRSLPSFVLIRVQNLAHFYIFCNASQIAEAVSVVAFYLTTFDISHLFQKLLTIRMDASFHQTFHAAGTAGLQRQRARWTLHVLFCSTTCALMLFQPPHFSFLLFLFTVRLLHIHACMYASMHECVRAVIHPSACLSVHPPILMQGDGSGECSHQ